MDCRGRGISGGIGQCRRDREGRGEEDESGGEERNAEKGKRMSRRERGSREGKGDVEKGKGMQRRGRPLLTTFTY